MGFPAEAQWLSISGNLVAVLFLWTAAVAILVQNLRKDIGAHNQSPTDEVALLTEQPKQTGWKVVHADVFRPPSSGSLLLCVCCGAGAQLLCAGLLTVIVAAIGYVSETHNGRLLMTFLLSYVTTGAINGYVAGRLHRTFQGDSWRRIAGLASLSFPGLAFSIFCLENLMSSVNGSTLAVPFVAILLLILWLGISAPLVLVGARLGFKQEPIEYPADTSSIPRPIPDQPWRLSLPVTMLLGGILPFGCCFTELDHVMGSAWMGMWYNTFGFLLVTLVLMLTTCAVITVLLAYFQLNRENYRWWWRSFANAGAASLYIFAYSIQYFRRFESTAVGTSVLYFGYMGLASLAVFLAMGSVGVASTLWFSKALFAYGRDKEIWIEIDRDQSSVLPKDDVRVVSHDPMIVTMQTTWPLSELPEG